MPIKNIIPGQRVSKQKLQRAKELRHEMTPAEKILWEQLRANKLGVHFRRQQVIAGFIVDFYCHRAGLIVEVDGATHGTEAEVIYDERRSAFLNEHGYRLLRFRNDDVYKALPDVCDAILLALAEKK